MKASTSRVPRRLPITAREQPLVVLVASPDAGRRGALVTALSTSPRFSDERDSIVEIADWEASQATTLRDGCVLFCDGALPEALLAGRESATAVVALGQAAGSPELDAVLPWPAPQAEVDTALHRLRELVWLRSRALGGAAAASRDKLARLNRIGTALSDIRQLDQLLQMVLTEARNILDADAGSIYIIERGAGASMSGRKVLGKAERKTRAVAVKRADLTKQLFSLRFAAAQNDSVTIPFEQIVFPANLESIAGYAAITGEAVVLDDVYELPPHAPFRFNRAVIDDKYGYRTRSMLTVPLRNTSDDIVGVVQLINKKRDPRRRLTSEDALEWITPFTPEDLELASSLGSQAGVAIENVRLMDAISNLFERFVIACVRAIEQRDPSTAGHSGRVDRITMGLADEVNRAQIGPFANVQFSDAEMTELHYAALLHDFGKIGVREHVLTKAEKLYPAQQQAIEFRAQLISLELRLRAAQQEGVLRAADEPEPRAIQALRDALQADLARLENDLAFVREHTRPVFLTDEKLARLQGIVDQPWQVNGRVLPLVTPEEFHSLKTRKGTLNDEERREIESHVEESWRFLKQIPWTDDLAHVPEIAGQHHEKMNGKGYPQGVPASETPLGSRLMAVADVFDSLTSSDRPYKPAIPLERALDILRAMAKDGELDPDVVNLFVETKVWGTLKLKLVRLADATAAQKAAH